MHKRSTRLIVIVFFLNLMNCQDTNNLINPLEGDDAYKLEDLLVNPGMGWTTFHSFENDAINEGYPPSSIAYYRIYWNDFEPERGNIPFSTIDASLDEAVSNGQTIALRLMSASDTEIKVPQWLLDMGINGVYYEFHGVETFVPDYEDPIFRSEAQRVINAFGAQYNGDPRIDHIDIGMVGHWGEWHVSKAQEYGLTMPSLDIKKKYIDYHLNAFPDTQLLMLLGEFSDPTMDDALRYAVEQGTGWRADCLGDLKTGWNHMNDGYPARITGAGVQDAWKNAPVAFESCGDMQTWYTLGYDVNTIFNYALDYHISILNAKSVIPPEEWVDEIIEFSKKMGYRYTLKSSHFNNPVDYNETLTLSMEWENLGVAPAYKGYLLAVRLHNPQDEQSFTLSTSYNTKSWLPGSFSIDASILLTTDITLGGYQVSLGLLDPNTLEPVIRLDNQGQTPDLWLPIGNLQVK